MEEEQQMSLIEEILSEENLSEAIKRVKANKGASGIDKMTINQLDAYFYENKKEIQYTIFYRRNLIIQRVCKSINPIN